MKTLISLLIEQYGGGDYAVSSNHRAALKVPKGGSCCLNCKYWKSGESTCGNEYFYKWAQTNEIPVAPDEYCSDWWEPM